MAKYQVFNGAENTRLMELMHETTIAQVDPSRTAFIDPC
jgi:hypothetical protein